MSETTTERPGPVSPPPVFRVVVALLVTLVIGVMGAALLAPRMVGGSPLVVRTTAMEPTLRVGDLAIVQPVLPALLDLGDVIAFYYVPGYLVAQRIIAISHDDAGEVAGLVTAADATYWATGQVRIEAVTGRVAYRLPQLGHVAGAPVATGGALAGLGLLGLAAWHQHTLKAR